MQWFDVDKQGLAKILERKGKPFVLFELIQNAIDEDTTRVDVKLERIPGTRSAHLIVEDDSPKGFADLTHAFTLFAESKKKADATKRGRFNLGEKLVLALCDTAYIRSTTGGVKFDADGRHAIRSKRDAGSIFAGSLKMTNEELDECAIAVHTLIPPVGVAISFNGSALKWRQPLKTIVATLPTEIGDDEGRLRRTARQTDVAFFEPIEGETATLYELGIPVVATGDRYHVNIAQKIPLTLDRDNVTPAYLSKVRALTVEAMEYRLTKEDANAVWVRDALDAHGDDLPVSTIETLADLRFGDKRVAFDPSDLEANHLAIAAGYTIVPGGTMSVREWAAMRRADAIQPAGRVTPSPKPFAPDGRPLKRLEIDSWTPGIRAIAAFAVQLGDRLLRTGVDVTIANEVTWPFAATYGGGSLILNLGRLGHSWFDRPDLAQVVGLLIHEFGHHYASNHLSDEYYDALTDLGGRAVKLAIAEPGLFVICD